VVKLFGVNLAKVINKEMGKGLLPGVLVKVEASTRTTGSLTAGTNPVDKKRKFRGFVEDYDVRQIDGTVVETGDRKVVILGGSLPAGVVPTTGDRINIEAFEGLHVMRVRRDPAGATYTCQVRG